MSFGTAVITPRWLCVLAAGSFVFGLPTDRPETCAATADLAQRAGVSFAPFVTLQPLAGGC